MEKSTPVQNTVVLLEPFRKLVKLVARAFYDDITTNSDIQQKSARSDNRGIAVVVLDALTRRQWVREEDLAKELQLHAKQLRKVIKLFEEQKLIMREHRKETAKDVKMYSAAVAATSDGRAKDKVKLHTHSYCCLDYAQICDVVRYKKKKLEDELEDKKTVQEYGCPNCQRKYTALDALIVDGSFRCEKCNGELVECDKLISEDGVDGDGNGKKGRREKLKSMLQKLKVQLKPLEDQLNIVKDLPIPEFGTFLQWKARAAMAARANGDLNPNDPLRSQSGSTTMPWETKVDITLGDGKEDVKPEGGDSSPKKLMPYWMIRQGMNLTAEQRGETRQEAQVDGSSGGASELSADKKSVTGNGGENDVKGEYVKAYLAEWLKQQELAARLNQQESDGESNPDTQLASTSSERQVGKKSKHEEEEEEDDVEWEEETPVPANNGNYYKADEEEEDVDWEEG